jgi:hypothetical protein
MLYFSTAVVSFILFLLIKNNFLKAALAVVPLFLAFLFSFSNLALANTLAELEFYTLAGFIFSQLLAYNFIVKNLAKKRLPATSNLATRETPMLSFVPKNPFLHFNLALVFTYIYLSGTAFGLVGTVVGLFGIVCAVVISGIQATLMPAIFFGLVIAVLGYLAELCSFNRASL